MGNDQPESACALAKRKRWLAHDLGLVFFAQSRWSGIEFGVDLAQRSSYLQNSETPFIPASTTKLFTAALALKELGPEFRFETAVEWKHVGQTIARELTLFASGDPTLGTYLDKGRIASWARRMREKGVRRVEGPIQMGSIDHRWEFSSQPPGLEDSDSTQCYGAQAGAWSFANQCSAFWITSPTNGRWDSLEIKTPVIVRLKRDRVTHLEIKAVGEPFERFEISGTWANQRRRAIPIFLPLAAPKELILKQFSGALAQAGIDYHPKVSTRAPASAVERSFSDFSPTLGEILVPMLKKSDNLFADALFKAVGARTHPEEIDLLKGGQLAMASLVSHLGTFAVRGFEAQAREGQFSPVVALFDGAGLSRESRVTVSALMALLRDLQAKPDLWFKPIFNALPIAGIDGTLARRMRHTAAWGAVHAKTGTMDGVSNLTGYIPIAKSTDPAQIVPFVLLTSTEAEKTFQARRALDEAAALFANSIRASE